MFAPALLPRRWLKSPTRFFPKRAERSSRASPCWHPCLTPGPDPIHSWLAAGYKRGLLSDSQEIRGRVSVSIAVAPPAGAGRSRGLKRKGPQRSVHG